METGLDLSKVLADGVKAAEASIVTVHSGRCDTASGLAWSSELVVTSAHALERGGEVEVSVGDARFVAKVVGVDPASDLGVLRVEGAPPLAPLARADVTALRVGEVVLALSRSARGLKARLGIVSRLGGEWRLGGGQRVERFVESDIVPAPGHAGSVLVTGGGALVGPNSAGIVRGSLVTLPAAAVGEVVDAIVKHGRVRRARLGVGLERVELPRAVAERRAQRRGLMVVSVLEGSPAERAGVLLGDVLLAVGESKLERVDDLMTLLDEQRIGVPQSVALLRAGAETALSVEPEAR